MDVVAVVGKAVEKFVAEKPAAARGVLEATYGWVALSGSLKGLGTYAQAVDRFNGAIAQSIIDTLRRPQDSVLVNIFMPPELLAAFGLDAVLMDGEEDDFEQVESLTHANLCSHAKAVIQQATAFDAVVFADRCDSLRRAFDVLDREGAPALCVMIDVPHEVDGCSVDRFASELVDFAEELAQRTGRPFNGNRFVAACRVSHDDMSDLGAVGDPFYAITGARVPGAVAEAIQNTLDLPVFDLTCGGGNRREQLVIGDDVVFAHIEAIGKLDQRVNLFGV